MICTQCLEEKPKGKFYYKNKILKIRMSMCKDCYNQKYFQKCISCHTEKPRSEFKMIIGKAAKDLSKRCIHCLEKKESFPQARCERCEKLFTLEFDPVKEKTKIPDRWLCKECVIVV